MRRPGVRARGVRGVGFRGGRLRVVGGFVGVGVVVEVVAVRRMLGCWRRRGCCCCMVALGGWEGWCCRYARGRVGGLLLPLWIMRGMRRRNLRRAVDRMR